MQGKNNIHTTTYTCETQAGTNKTKTKQTGNDKK